MMRAISGAVAQVVCDAPDWPSVFEMNVGDSVTVTGAVTRTITVLRVDSQWMPDYWISDNPARRTFAAATVRIDVSGVEAVLTLRPFQLPQTVNGLRLYVEATREVNGAGELVPLRMCGEVRISICDEGESWGPETAVFPIRQYRWRSSTYNNTHTALVPYNALYLHRGDDFGAIPDRLPVVALLPGTVVASPLPHGDGASNRLFTQVTGGVVVGYSHMNVETIDPALIPGAPLALGQAVGKTGCTWSGRRSQHFDPHLHVQLKCNGEYISAYPLLVDAYFRSYPDSALPVAGGYYFTVPGEAVLLDASCSVARAGRRIVDMQWRLHDGTLVDGATAQVRYEKPGAYAEELTITTDDGVVERDFAQVRVYDPQADRNFAHGWLHYTPVRDITPDIDVLFWNRVMHSDGPVLIDFGDGTPPAQIAQELTHRYAQPGLYTVTLSGHGPQQEPFTLKTRVVVEARTSG